MSDQFFWFATRGAGIMAWFSACLSVLAGLTLSSRVLGRRPTIPWLTDFHRYLGAMAMVFLATHMTTLWADGFVSFGLDDLLIPGRAEVPGLSRLSLALGVVSAWLLAVVELSSLIKRYLPPQLWHTLHLTSFSVVLAGTVHAIEAGTDTGNHLLLSAGASVLTAIVLVGVIRCSSLLSDRKSRYEADADDPLTGQGPTAGQRNGTRPRPRAELAPPAPAHRRPPGRQPAGPAAPRRPPPRSVRPPPRPVGQQPPSWDSGPWGPEQPVRWEDRR
jgi:DMSO/TMAO reductase YedYZ heme-binding membrane subunit